MRNSLADVVAAALRVLEAQGLENCSMRRVAAELGVQPSALYHHVPNKQTLLALMADEIVAGVSASDEAVSAEDSEAMGADLQSTDGDSAVSAAWAQAQAHTRRSAARRACADLRAAMLSVRDGAEVVSSAAAFKLGASAMEDHLAQIVGRDGARTLLLYSFGQAQSTQLHRHAAAFGALVGTPEAVVPPVGDDLEASFTRGIDIILAGLAGLPHAEPQL